MSKLIAKENRIYTETDEYICSLSMTQRAKDLLDDEGWRKGEESWADYRARTKGEREAEEKKRHQMAANLVEAFNNSDRLIAERDELRSRLADLESLESFLYDGHAVYSSLTDEEKKHTHGGNVLTVLDALVRLIKQQKPE